MVEANGDLDSPRCLECGDEASAGGDGLCLDCADAWEEAEREAEWWGLGAGLEATETEEATWRAH